MDKFLLSSTFWPTVANVATALALLVAAGAFIWQIISHRGERAYTKSHFALQSALESYEQAMKILSDGNNNRVTWITAARIVERANQISTKITEQVHKDVFEVQLEHYRRQVAGILGFDDPTKMAWFFYGTQSIGADPDTAAKESTKPIKIGTVNKGQTRYLSEQSLATLYELAEYPLGYEDPLKKESFAGKIGVGMKADFPGLYEFLTHRAEYQSINGKLVKRDQKDGA